MTRSTALADVLVVHWSARVTARLGAGPVTDLGHLGTDPRGAPCACGGRGCLEGEIGAPALADRLGTLIAAEIGVAELVAACRAGDRRARRLVGRAATLLGGELAPVCAVASVRLVALSGPLAATGAAVLEPLGDALRARWAGRVELLELEIGAGPPARR